MSLGNFLLNKFRFRGLKRSTPAKSQIYIDLTDVVTHAIWHRTCAGIPRVQLGIAMTLVRARENVVPFSLYGNSWRDLRPIIEKAQGNTDLLLRGLDESLPMQGVYPSVLRPVQTVRLAKTRFLQFITRVCTRPPVLNCDSTVFVGGAFWTSPAVVALCKRAAAAKANLIILVHDLIPFIHPEYTGHDFFEEYREIISLPAHFVVTTEYNRDCLQKVRKELGIYDKTPISILPLAHEFPGAERNARPGKAPARLASLRDRDFALCVGTVEIRKNHMMLFYIWQELAGEFGERLLPLVVAGRRGWKAEAALDMLDDIFNSNRLIFVEAPTDEELQWLYAACSFTVFPSHFEGWGLPVGESLWFGKPCATSNTSSIPKVGGDLCVYFSPFHATTIKEAIRSLLDVGTRRAYTARIASAPLRTWCDVMTDLVAVIDRLLPARDNDWRRAGTVPTVVDGDESGYYSDGNPRCPKAHASAPQS